MRKANVKPGLLAETEPFPAARVFVPLNPGERPWSHLRRGVTIALVFGAQIGLIFAFGDHKPVVPRQSVNVPELHLASADNPWLALESPALFALPDRNGFSASAWLQQPEKELQPYEWTEPARWLPLPVGRLGTVLSQFMQTNVFPTFAFDTRPVPKLNLPPAPSLESASMTPSLMRLEGGLVERRLINLPQLPSWPAADLLVPSVVQVLVDEAGNVLTATLLPPSSLTPGSVSKEASDRALEIARALQFAPVSHTTTAPSRWTRGTAIFEWQAVPLPPVATSLDTP